MHIARMSFASAASGKNEGELDGLHFLIRTDARFATDGFRKNLLCALSGNSSGPIFNGRSTGHEMTQMEADVLASVHNAYREWGHSVLGSISRHVNYDLYNISNSALSVDFFDSHALAEKIAKNADEFLASTPGYDETTPTVYVSLDEMFHECRSPWAEIAFSRLFSLKGDQQFGYTARPGKKPIDEQLNDFVQQVKDLKDMTGQDVKIVLLEDNVRHAKMLNWVIDLMDKKGVFEHASVACISTCFCSASEQERAAIVSNGKSVPLVAAAEWDSKSFEVSTPRDLFFDGYVVEVDGETTRLPGIFMDVEKLFKVCPEKVEEFTEEIRGASLRFCEQMEKEWGINPPLAWFTGAKAIAHITGKSLETPMSEILSELDMVLKKDISFPAKAAVSSKPA